MEVKHFKTCPECNGRGGVEKGIIPDPITLRKPGIDPVLHPVDCLSHWEPCTRCEGTGAVAKWVWVGL